MALRESIPAVLLAALLAIPAGATSLQVMAQDSRAGSLHDRSAFQAFVQSRPTPEEFEQAYPDLWLILPGDIVTREVCSQYYRFIAELDAEGRIAGGSLE
jgi:hypothetical protein